MYCSVGLDQLLEYQLDFFHIDLLLQNIGSVTNRGNIFHTESLELMKITGNCYTLLRILYLECIKGGFVASQFVGDRGQETVI